MATWAEAGEIPSFTLATIVETDNAYFNPPFAGRVTWYEAGRTVLLDTTGGTGGTGGVVAVPKMALIGAF